MLGAKAGIKRRASSPHREATREDRTSVSSSTAGEHDLYHRRSMQQLPNRISPVARYPANHGSVSSASSLGRNGSLASSHGLLSVASSATSYSSGRISPTVAMSPAIDPELGCGTPFAAVKSLNSSPRDSISYPPPHQLRTFSESSQGDARKMSTDSMSQSRQNSISSNAQGLFICECCPKKPKKFRSQEELRYVHDMFLIAQLAQLYIRCPYLGTSIRTITLTKCTVIIITRSNMLALIVQIVSKTRTKQSGTRTHSI